MIVACAGQLLFVGIILVTRVFTRYPTDSRTDRTDTSADAGYTANTGSCLKAGDEASALVPIAIVAVSPRVSGTAVFHTFHQAVPSQARAIRDRTSRVTQAAAASKLR